jgi:hypothetical protein
MTKTTITVLSLATAALFGASHSASAQTPANFLNISVGAQPQQRTVDAAATSVIYDEDAVFAATHEISNGPFFDFSFGHEVRPSFSVGAGLSFFTSKGNASGTGSIPDPIFVGQPTEIPVSLDDLSHSEQFINLTLTYFKPLTDKFDVALSAGPSIVHASQEFLSGQLSDDGNSITILPDDQGGWGFGLNIGGDVTYLVTPRYGVGVLLRYTYGKVGMDAADLTVGGFQAGAGLRVRF